LNRCIEKEMSCATFLFVSAAIIALSILTPSKFTLLSDAYAQQEKKKQERERNPVTGKKVPKSGETYEQCVERKRARGGRRARSCNS
jgi:hypothetical protein